MAAVDRGLVSNSMPAQKPKATPPRGRPCTDKWALRRPCKLQRPCRPFGTSGLKLQQTSRWATQKRGHCQVVLHKVATLKVRKGCLDALTKESGAAVRQHSVLRRVLRRFWEGFWGRGLRRVLRRGPAMGFRVLRRVLRRGSEKGVSRRCPAP